MRRLLILATVAVLAAGAIGTASAHDNNSGTRAAKASLGGFAEVPAISTTGSGRLKLSLDKANTTITFELSYKDLQGVPSSGALYLGQKGVNGGLIAYLCGGGGKPACPASPTAAAITGTIVAANLLGPVAQGITGTTAGDFAEVLRAIKAGMAYASVNTGLYPNGEIRGQVGGGWH